MRLRTFDGDGDTPEGASPPISKINVGPHGRPLVPTPRIIPKIGAVFLLYLTRRGRRVHGFANTRIFSIANAIGAEAAFGMEAVCFPEGPFSPTTFRASRMRASAISVVEDDLEFH